MFEYEFCKFGRFLVNSNTDSDSRLGMWPILVLACCFHDQQAWGITSLYLFWCAFDTNDSLVSSATSPEIGLPGAWFWCVDMYACTLRFCYVAALCGYSDINSVTYTIEKNDVNLWFIPPLSFIRCCHFTSFSSCRLELEPIVTG